MTCPEVQVFDLRDETHALQAREWNPRRRRDPAELLGVVLHQWGTPVGTEARHRLRHGEPGALARRSLAAPYHVSCGVTRAGVPVVALAHPLERYTHASDAGNRSYVAVGVMGLFAFDAGRHNPARHNPARHSAMTDALRAAIDRALLEAIAMLGDSGPWRLIAHRQCANGPGDHLACPGEAIVEAALRSSAVRDGHLVADPDLVLLPEHGKSWPDAWRRHLHEAERPSRREYHGPMGVVVGDPGGPEVEVDPPPAQDGVADVRLDPPHRTTAAAG